MLTKFPCSGCGACCKRINVVAESIDLSDKQSPFYFPYSYDQNGKCENLTDDNKCAIYDTRPMLCNIDLFIDTFGLDRLDFYRENITQCNRFMDEDNIPNNFRITL